jgi:hypothetical protein
MRTDLRKALHGSAGLNYGGADDHSVRAGGGAGGGARQRDGEGLIGEDVLRMLSQSVSKEVLVTVSDAVRTRMDEAVEVGFCRHRERPYLPYAML